MQENVKAVEPASKLLFLHVTLPTLKEYALKVGRGFKLLKEIGKGGFGRIFIAERERSKFGKVAIKTEKEPHKNYLAKEFEVYRKLGNSPFIPRFYRFEEINHVKFLVLELLGPNLMEIFVHNDYDFSTKTHLLIAIQTLKCIEFIHKMHYIHGDIKPENFVVRLVGDIISIVLCDFGLSLKWYDSTTKTHIKYNSDFGRFGTYRFMSINTHEGIRASRRDDLESLGYLFAFLLYGDLPWQDLKLEKDYEYSQTVLEIKKGVSHSLLFWSASKVYDKYLTSVKNLGFHQNPRYDFYIRLFEQKYLKNGYRDVKFDWDLNFDKYHEYQRNKSSEITCPIYLNDLSYKVYKGLRHLLNCKTGTIPRKIHKRKNQKSIKSIMF